MSELTPHTLSEIKARSEDGCAYQSDCEALLALVAELLDIIAYTAHNRIAYYKSPEWREAANALRAGKEPPRATE